MNINKTMSADNSTPVEIEAPTAVCFKYDEVMAARIHVRRNALPGRRWILILPEYYVFTP